MVSRWKLDEIIGTAAPYTTPDQWGSNQGTIYNISLLEKDCISEKCFKFIKNDSTKVDFGDPLNQDTSGYTISVWVKIEKYQASQVDSYYDIIFSRANNYWGDAPLGFTYNSEADTLIFNSNFFNTSGVQCQSGRVNGRPVNISNDHKWNFLLMTFDKQNKIIEIFLNGKKHSVISDVDYLVFLSNNHYYSGGNLSPDRFLNGFIDDIRIYNAALTSSKIKQNYIAGLNSMLANGNISREDYNERINNLAYNDNNE